MAGDPSRRPSHDRVRVAADVNAVVWIECASCLGDGWHYPMGGVVDRARKSRKITCASCGGHGARQVPLIQCSPGARVVATPKGQCQQGDE